MEPSGADSRQVIGLSVNWNRAASLEISKLCRFHAQKVGSAISDAQRQQPKEDSLPASRERSVKEAKLKSNSLVSELRPYRS